jgi:hypothetical protein
MESITSEFLILHIFRAMLGTAGFDPSSMIRLAGLATLFASFE